MTRVSADCYVQTHWRIGDFRGFRGLREPLNPTFRHISYLRTPAFAPNMHSYSVSKKVQVEEWHGLHIYYVVSNSGGQNLTHSCRWLRQSQFFDTTVIVVLRRCTTSSIVIRRNLVVSFCVVSLGAVPGNFGFFLIFPRMFLADSAIIIRK